MLREIFSSEFWRALFSPSPLAEPRQLPKNYSETEVSFNSNGNILSGTLTVPHSVVGLPCTVAVLIHGSGRMDRNSLRYGHKPFEVIADELSENDIAVLRYDKRGIGESEGDYGTATTFDFADDALAAVDYVKNLPGLGAERIVLIGHSEGGMIASIVANCSEDVDAIIMLAAPALPGDELMLGQIAYACRMNNLDERQTGKQLDLARHCYRLLLEHPDNNEAIPLLEALIAANTDASVNQVVLLGAVAADEITSKWDRAFLSYDPRPALTGLRCPVLALHGLNDKQVLAADHLPEMRAALAKSAADYAVVEISGVNHILQMSPTGAVSEYAGIKEDVDLYILGLLQSFIERVL
jgi:pimeloyl-ACP methyl ester carboxylesterase